MSGFFKIKITDTEAEIKAIVGKAKDANSPQKMQSLYWLNTPTVETVSSIDVRVGKHRTERTEMVV